MTTVSLGTTGTRTSRYATRRTMRYAQPDAFETASVNCPEIGG
jgi:hypothetical protein